MYIFLNTPGSSSAGLVQTRPVAIKVILGHWANVGSLGKQALPPTHPRWVPCSADGFEVEDLIYSV